MTAKLLLGLGATTATLCAGEAIVQRIHVPSSLPIAHRVPHPTRGWHTEPNAQVTFATSEFRVRVAYNSKGWRDRERNYLKPKGALRALVLGDSFMEAYSVPFDRIFAQQMESLMSARRGKEVEVLNLGVGGYGTLQQYLAFVEEGAKYAPDVVLLGFFTNNDLSDNSLTISRTIRREGSLRLRSRPFLDASAEWAVIPPDYTAARQAFDRNRPKGSNFAPLRLIRRSALYGLLDDALQSNARGHEGDLSSDAYRAVYLCHEPAEYLEAWQLTERILVKLATAVRASGAELVVFSVPSQIEMAPSLSTEFCLADPPSSRRLPAILAKHQISYVDLLPAFREAHRRGTKLHWELDGHWTEDGHALAARRISEALLHSGR